MILKDVNDQIREYFNKRCFFTARQVILSYHKLTDPNTVELEIISDEPPKLPSLEKYETLKKIARYSYRIETHSVLFVDLAKIIGIRFIGTKSELYFEDKPLIFLYLDTDEAICQIEVSRLYNISQDEDLFQTKDLEEYRESLIKVYANLKQLLPDGTFDKTIGFIPKDIQEQVNERFKFYRESMKCSDSELYGYLFLGEKLPKEP